LLVVGGSCFDATKEGRWKVFDVVVIVASGGVGDVKGTVGREGCG